MISDRIWDNVFVGADESNFAASLSELTVVVVFIYLILPIDWIIKELTNFRKIKDSEVTYDQAVESFSFTYDNSNPTVAVTKIGDCQNIDQVHRVLTKLVDYGEKFDLVEVISTGRTKNLMIRKRFKKAVNAIKAIRIMKTCSLKTG